MAVCGGLVYYEGDAGRGIAVCPEEAVPAGAAPVHPSMRADTCPRPVVTGGNTGRHCGSACVRVHSRGSVIVDRRHCRYRHCASSPKCRYTTSGQPSPAVYLHTYKSEIA